MTAKKNRQGYSEAIKLPKIKGPDTRTRFIFIYINETNPGFAS
jgi:hypothetical protein